MRSAVTLLRYLAREIYGHVLAILSILLVILIANQILDHLSAAAAGKITPSSLVKLLVVQAPLLIGFLLPLSFFVSLLVILGQWSANRELTIWFASGLSYYQLLMRILMIALVIALITMASMFWLEPYMNWFKKDVLAHARTSSPLNNIVPGHFQSLRQGGWALYTASIDSQANELKQVFGAKLPTDQALLEKPSVVVMARRAQQISQEGVQFLQFVDGHKYQGRPGGKDFEVTAFDKFGIKIHEPKAQIDNDPQFMSMSQLWSRISQSGQAAAEFQWRLTMPISVFMLSALALILVPTRPLNNRFALLVPGMIIYMIYGELLFISRAWLQQQVMAHWLGLWWVHVLLLVALVLAAVCRWGAFSRLLKHSIAKGQS
jgi:lipopolysaccharide export system permease protein